MKFLIIAALVAVASAAPQFRPMEIKRTSVMMPGAYAVAEPQMRLLAHEHLALAQPAHLKMAREHLMLAQPRLHMASAMPAAMPLTKEGGAEIVEQVMDMNEPGHYLYHFKTNNGIAMMEQAAHDKDAAKVQGAYEWTSPEGANFKVEYVADEMGFHPVGAHLPVAPAIPEDIMRSLQWNAAHPEEDKEASMYLAKKIMY